MSDSRDGYKGSVQEKKRKTIARQLAFKRDEETSEMLIRSNSYCMLVCALLCICIYMCMCVYMFICI